MLENTSEGTGPEGGGGGGVRPKKGTRHLSGETATGNRPRRRTSVNQPRNRDEKHAPRQSAS